MPTEHDRYARRHFQEPPPPEREYQPWEVLTREHEQGQRNEWYRRRIRESIESPVMRAVVAEAHRLTGRIGGVPWKRSAKDYLQHVEGNSADARKYRDWVREMLSKSDLAQRIPGGRDALPDIQDAMREPWRSIERLREPRDYEQLVQHLVKHLDWYLDPSQPVKPPLASMRFLFSFVALCLFVGGLYAVKRLFPAAGWDGFWFFGYGIVGSAVTYFASLVWGRHKTTDGTVFNYHRVRDLIHAAELYYYLVEVWVDPQVLDEPAATSN